MKNEGVHVVTKSGLVYPELGYRVVGVLFDVFNTLGYGHRELYYERAVAQGLEQAGLKFKQQVNHSLIFKGKSIGTQRFDFLIENKLVLELKQGTHFSPVHIKQLHGYLLSSNLRLGILAYFSPQGIKYKRIVNIK